MPALDPLFSVRRRGNDGVLKRPLMRAASVETSAMCDPVFVNTEGAAERLCLAASTLEKMRVHGDGPPFIQLTRRRIVYDVATLDAWARSRQFNSTSEYAPAGALLSELPVVPPSADTDFPAHQAGAPLERGSG